MDCEKEMNGPMETTLDTPTHTPLFFPCNGELGHCL